MRTPKILTTMKTYDRPTFAADVISGITVALVAIPLSLAIAIASGADPGKGLVTAAIGGLLVSLLGGSRVQIGGPTGAFIVVVYGVIEQHGYDGLLMATLMAGAILVVAGWFRAGRLIAIVPEAVVNGFTIGIAVIIATSQIKDFFGMSVERLPAGFVEKVPVLWDARASVNPWAVLAGFLTAILIVALRRRFPRWPGLIVAVAVASLAFGMPGLVDTIDSRFGALPYGLPAPSWPKVELARFSELLPSALVIAFLAGVESLLSAMVADRMIKGQHRPSAELTAQGVANIGSALFGGLPVTGAIARTATNIRAGGKTPVAGIVHALVVVGTVYVLGPMVAHLALPALAALLMLTAWNMAEPHRWADYVRGRRSDLALMLLTLVLTVVADLTVAIGVGVVLGLAARLNRRPVPIDWSMPDR